MCLLSKTNKPMVAKKDIVCYKETLCNCWHGEYYRTPYRDTMISNDIINGKIPFIAYGPKSVSQAIYNNYNNKIIEGCFEVSSGYIHSFSRDFFQRKIELFKKSLGWWHTTRYSVYFKCIIPKGTKYFISTNGDEYASDQIIFKKKMTKSEIYKEFIITTILSIFKGK